MGFDIGTQIAGAGAGFGMGMIQDSINDGRARDNADYALDNTIKLNQFNHGLQMDLFNRTGYEAQMRQMKNAGLNPALMYKGGGAGGSVNATTQNAPEVQTKDSKGMEGMGMMLQQGLMKAQIENLEADADKKKVEATKIGGVDTENTKTQTASLTQGIQNQKAVEALTRADQYLKEIEGEVMSTSAQDRIDQIRWNTDKAFQELKIAENETYISNATKNDKVKIITETAIGATLGNEILIEQKNKITQEIWAIIQNVNISNKQQEIMKALNEGNLDLRQKELIAKIAIESARIVTNRGGGESTTETTRYNKEGDYLGESITRKTMK